MFDNWEIPAGFLVLASMGLMFLRWEGKRVERKIAAQRAKAHIPAE